jgi:hypothetical protein
VGTISECYNWVYFNSLAELTRRPTSVICIGLSEDHVNLEKLPGWEQGSIAYHGDDGRAFDSWPFADIYGPKFMVGDVVGCGISDGGSLGYYTKNGRHLG